MSSPSFQQQLLERALRLQAQARARPPPGAAAPVPAAAPPPRPAVLEASQLPSVQRAAPAVGPERLQELQQLARPPPPAPSAPRAPSEAVKRKLQDLRPQQKSIPKRPFELYLKDWKTQHPEFATRKKEARALASQAYKVESRAVLKQYDERARALQLQQRAEMELEAFSPDPARHESKVAVGPAAAAASSDMVLIKRPRPPPSSPKPPAVAAPQRASLPNEAFLAELERQLFPPGT